MAPRGAPKRKARRTERRRKQEAAGRPDVMARGQVLSFKRPGGLFNLVRQGSYAFLTKGATDRGYAFNFQLSQLAQTSDFTALFDQYRVLWYELCVQWVPDGGYLQAPTLYMAQDWDGLIGTPATLNSMLAIQNLKTVNFSVSERTVTFHVDRPAILVSTPNAGNAVVQRSPWLDLADTGELHYGLIAWLAFYNTTIASGDVTITLRAHIQLRAVR